MVTLSAHGGGCCGMRHLRGFGPDENANPDLIDQALAGAINGQGVEVVLNHTQVTNYPRVLERLAELGFVLDGHWRNGNHGAQAFLNREAPTEGELGSHNYRFTRADRRQPLAEGPIANRWAGMVITPGLNGLLEQMHNVRNQAGRDARLRQHYTRPLPQGYTTLWTRGGGNADLTLPRAGDTVRVSNRASRRFDREFVVVRVSGDQWYRRIHMHDDVEQRDFQLTIGSVQLVRRAEDGRPVYVRGTVGQRVQYCGHGLNNNNWNNGEYATIVAVGWPYLQVQFDRQPGQAQRINVHAQYLVLRDDEGAEPLIAPPAPEAIPARQPQLHQNAEVLLERPAPVAEEAVAPAAPTVLFRRYRNIYRDGRVGAAYDTLDDCRMARRGAGRIDREEFLSDGTSRMVENIQE